MVFTSNVFEQLYHLKKWRQTQIFQVQFWWKKVTMHILLKKKQVLLCCEKNKIERKLIFIESLIFFFFFFFSFFLPSNRRNIFYRNLHHPIQGRLSLLISKSVWHNFAEKYAKISVFLAAMIRLWRTLTSLCTVTSGSSLRGLFCNYQLCNDATMVSRKLKEK